MEGTSKSVSTPLGVRSAPRGAQLEVFSELVEPEFLDSVQLLETGLRLLVKRLKVESAVIVQVSSLGFELIWWATRNNAPVGAEVQDPLRNFCSMVLEKPNRTLVIRDAPENKLLQAHPALRGLNTRAYIGVPLRRANTVIGVLSVQSSKPRKFTRSEVVLMNIIGNLFSKALEIEHLKHELHTTREALDLSMAVVTDSAMEAPDTHLPNRRYLEVWLKAVLFMVRRRSEIMTVVVWHLLVNRETVKQLKQIAERTRGEDLLVDLGRGSFALLLPHTPPQGAEVFLSRVREILGPIPMGATVWHPLAPADANDFSIRAALRRASEALHRCRERDARDFNRAEWVIPRAARKALSGDPPFVIVASGQGA